MSMPISKFIPSLFPLGIHTFVLYVCVSISIKKIVYTNFFRFHIYALIYDIRFALSDLLYIVNLISCM